MTLYIFPAILAFLLFFFYAPDHMLNRFVEHRGADFRGDFQDCMFQIGFKATYYLNLKLCFSFCL